MSAGYRLIEACLAADGREAFAGAFLDLAAWMGADQIMVFAVGDDGARCLVSRHFSRLRLGGLLAARYLDGWYRKDPLLPELRGLPPGEIRVRRMADFAGRMAEDYRAIFFDRAGLADKTALLMAGRTRRLMLNLYRADGAAEAEDPDLLRLAGRLLLRHFDRPEEAGYPAPLAALSERERAVCLGILAGQKAEAIAGALGLSPATVVTYRRRAYQKLGVSARAELFAICRRP